MSDIIRRLWDDDEGAVVSVELILVIGILVFGLIPGLVALRNSVNASLATMGNFLTQITPSFTYSGFAITGNPDLSNTKSYVAVVGGLSLAYQLDPAQVDPNNPTATNLLDAAQTAPTQADYIVVSPAP